MKKKRQRELQLRRHLRLPRLLERKRKGSPSYKLSSIERRLRLRRQDLLMKRRKKRDLLPRLKRLD